jgi:hypothetical protein
MSSFTKDGHCSDSVVAIRRQLPLQQLSTCDGPETGRPRIIVKLPNRGGNALPEHDAPEVIPQHAAGNAVKVVGRHAFVDIGPLLLPVLEVPKPRLQ